MRQPQGGVTQTRHCTKANAATFLSDVRDQRCALSIWSARVQLAGRISQSERMQCAHRSMNASRTSQPTGILAASASSSAYDSPPSPSPSNKPCRPNPQDVAVMMLHSCVCRCASVCFFLASTRRFTAHDPHKSWMETCVRDAMRRLRRAWTSL